MSILSLTEHVQIEEMVNLIEGEQTQFTEEQFEKAEFYNLKWDPVSGDTLLFIYDADGNGLGSVAFEDAEIAIAFVEEYFELDDEDLEDLENYSWASEDNYYDRELDSLDLAPSRGFPNDQSGAVDGVNLGDLIDSL